MASSGIRAKRPKTLPPKQTERPDFPRRRMGQYRFYIGPTSHCSTYLEDDILVATARFMDAHKIETRAEALHAMIYAFLVGQGLLKDKG